MITFPKTTAILIIISLVFLVHICSHAATVEYELVIAKKEVNITGKPALAMTINGGIPGPALRFKEGDTARIHVHNEMDVATSIHWHGLLVPPEMDGVPYISFPPIKAGKTFTYEFPIRQSGTYWYHSHSGLQEQRGMYGSIVIEPKQSDHDVENEHVIVLSDWTDEDPYKVNRTLKRGSEWYSIKKRSGQSIFGAARIGLLHDYFSREAQRMPPMDISDVAYDRFLANGKPETVLSAKPKEKVRLRIINGSATTYFHVEFAGSPMTIVSADGINVEPFKETRFLIAVAETYDLIVTIPGKGLHEFRATAHDGSGFASVWLGSGNRHYSSDIPRPNLYHSMGGIDLKRVFSLTPAGAMGMPDSDVKAGKFDMPGMTGMHEMKMDKMPGISKKGNMLMHGKKEHPAHSASKEQPKHHHSAHEKHAVHDEIVIKKEKAVPHSLRDGKRYKKKFSLLSSDVSSSRSLAMDGDEKERPWPPYARLRSVKPTAFSKDKPVRKIRLTLDGDMERYVWFLNNRPLSETDSIRIRKGEIVRIIMINRTMMHHPMHLHGHFFRVLNGQGDHAPLKHTVDVSPMSTTVIEFDANEFGDWFFHCHLLYHMKAGMARVIHYENYIPDPQLNSIRPNLYKDSVYYWGQADLLTNMSEGFLTLSDSRDIFKAEWEVGWHDVEHTESEGIFTYNRYINRFFALFTGIDFMSEGDDEEETRGIFGFGYLLPLNIESRSWIDTDGGARFNLEKRLHLTPRIEITGEVDYDTHEQWEGSVGLSYMIQKNLSLVGQWHSEYRFGVGLQVRF